MQRSDEGFAGIGPQPSSYAGTPLTIFFISSTSN